MNSLISIIIPTKNAEKDLLSLMRSLTRQKYKKFEVIINDDKSSPDGTATLIKNFQKNLRITYIHRNRSMAQGRKEGAKIAKGSYQMHIDADMMLDSNVLKECMTVIKKNDALIIPEVSVGEGYWASVKSFERSLYVGDETIESARFFRTDVYKKIGGHNEKIVFSEDKDIDLRIRKMGGKVGRIKAVIFHNEGKLSLFRDLRKKYHYGKTASLYIKNHKSAATKQGNVLFRPAYFRNWKKIVRNPQLAGGMFIMKFLEFCAVCSGLVIEKISIK